MLDAYIIEDIKRQEEARQRSEGDRRPRLYIDRSEGPIPVERAPELDDDEDSGPIRIDIRAPTVPLRPEVNAASVA